MRRGPGTWQETSSSKTQAQSTVSRRMGSAAALSADASQFAGNDGASLPKSNRVPRPTRRRRLHQRSLPPLPSNAPTSHAQCDTLCTQDAAGPELTQVNAAGRFVLAPASLWPEHASEDTGGYIGKIEKCLKTAQQPTSIKLKDATATFSFAYVKAEFKMLS